ncbi:MAG: flagellar basal body P-ring protein FlgI [Vampirovibrionales bacterium]
MRYLNNAFKPQLRSMTSVLACTSLLFGVLVTGFLLPHADAKTSISLKNLVRIKDVRMNQVVGYGLVVGLNGTGDSSVATRTAQWNMLNNLGGRISNPNDLQGSNAAQVMVIAKIPPFAKAGDSIDVTLSAIGKVKSLEGGVLISSQLLAPNGEVIAVAQGPVSTGGSSVSSGGASKQTAITTSARIPNGGIIEREMHTQVGDATGVTLVLNRTDYTLANRIAAKINTSLCPAVALDGSSIRVELPTRYLNNRVAFVSVLEQLTVDVPNDNAKVVVNERTGTVVIGSSVKLQPAAVAHGGITVTIQSTNEAVQPNALAGGDTALVTNDRVDITKEKGSLIELGANNTLHELVTALNAIGVTPSDLISILQALKAAGSLEAELEII